MFSIVFYSQYSPDIESQFQPIFVTIFNDIQVNAKLRKQIGESLFDNIFNIRWTWYCTGFDFAKI